MHLSQVVGIDWKYNTVQKKKKPTYPEWTCRDLDFALVWNISDRGVLFVPSINPPENIGKYQIISHPKSNASDFL